MAGKRMTREEWAAMVPDIDERELSARLFTALSEAEAAVEEAEKAVDDAASGVFADIEAAYRAEVYEARLRRDKKISEVKDFAPAKVAALAAWDVAETAYYDHPGRSILTDDTEQPMRCMLSGVPLYEDDVTFPVGGRHILAALFLSPEDVAALAEEIAAEGDEDDETSEGAAA